MSANALDKAIAYKIEPIIGSREWTGWVGERLTLPTREPLTHNGDAAHPSVVHVPGGRNGNRYWMAYNPYAGGSDAYDDPCIVAPNDGTNWIVPAGAPFPLDNAPVGTSTTWT
ncbi:hypothetical protein ACWF5H_17770 [Arthrobacter sp. NPDC055138]